MNLISKEIINNIKFVFYDGIDFDILENHPKDGSDGFMYFFVEDWGIEVSKIKRNNIIEKVLDDSEKSIKDYNNINNDYIIIYQTSKNIITKESIINTIRENLYSNMENKYIL